MYKLKTIEKKVREILIAHPESRDDDMKLYLLICQDSIAETHGRANLSFEEVMTNYKELGCPRFESVRRTRQKIQATTPELRCTVSAQKRRNKGIAAYTDYALDKEDSVNG